jgi:poly(hydroxyalkanoate) depolymerase family esterase
MMRDATLLTRRGDLRAATATILTALGRHSPASGTEDVIDVEARSIPDPDAGVPPVAALTDEGPSTKEQPTFDDGCGESFNPGRFGTASAARDYKLYVPPAAGTKRLPLVVMLHGCTQDPDDFAAGTRMNDAAREQGMFVLYPAQSGKANPQRCWNWFKHNHQARGRGEPALLAAMVQEIIARYPIDAERVYVAGLSAGGAMAAILASAYPEVFAAVGVHSGLPAGAARDLPSALQAMKNGSTRPHGTGAQIPTIVIHGDRDRTVHPVNGENIFGCTDGTSELQEGRTGDGHRWTRRMQRDGTGKVIAEHWSIHGADHAWSGGSERGSFTDPRGPDATAAMLRFFAQHRRKIQ